MGSTAALASCASRVRRGDLDVRPDPVTSAIRATCAPPSAEARMTRFATDPGHCLRFRPRDVPRVRSALQQRDQSASRALESESHSPSTSTPRAPARRAAADALSHLPCPRCSRTTCSTRLDILEESGLAPCSSDRRVSALPTRWSARAWREHARLAVVSPHSTPHPPLQDGKLGPAIDPHRTPGWRRPRRARTVPTTMTPPVSARAASAGGRRGVVVACQRGPARRATSARAPRVLTRCARGSAHAGTRRTGQPDSVLYRLGQPMTGFPIGGLRVRREPRSR